jgi:predicted ATPase
MRGSLFLGRSAELEAIRARFEEGARLVTLVGPGGIGKTALAREVASRRGGEVAFVDLEAAGDAAGIADAAAVACGATDAGAAIAARGEVLLVLDNFDGLGAFAMETVGAWLEAAPEAEILVTSRERLGLVAEDVIEIGPLDAAPDLIAASARRVAASFAPRAEDVACIVEIARVLDGVPLALEMAGVRLPLVGAQALLAELRGGAALVRDARGGPSRHASLDAAVKGSFDALSAHEKDALAALTVFRGGFDAESAAAIAGASLEVLSSLSSRSLVRTRDAGAARFDLYASVRAFVARSHPAAGAAERHTRWFVDRAERAAAEAHASTAARAWLVAERENVLAVAERALSGSVGPTEAETALRAIVALSPLLLAHGPLERIAALASPIVERTRDSGAEPRLSARATILRGALRRERRDMRGALVDLLAAESIGRALSDELIVADAGIELGRTVLAAGEIAAGRDHFEKAARAFASLGARSREAAALVWLGIATCAGGYAGHARAILDRALALSDALARPAVLVALGRACAEAGDPAAARRALEEASQSSDARNQGDAVVTLGLVAHESGDRAQAATLFARARDVFAVAGLDVDAAIARGHLGVLAREEGRAAEAYALLADARDASLRARRAEPASYFAIHLSALDGDVAALGAVKATGLEGWPIGIEAVAAAARDALAGRTTDPSTATLHSRITRRSLASAPRVAARPPDDALVVGEGGAWFRAPGGARVGLERRRSLALILDRLAALRTERPGATIGSAALFASAWPGEKALPTAAAHRVRVAVATLRKMGLRDAIVTQPDGYALSADVPLVRA